MKKLKKKLEDVWHCKRIMKGSEKMAAKQDVKVTGYSKGNGKVVHVIVVGGHPLCEAYKGDEAKSLKLDRSLNVTDVTCKKCKRGRVFKDLQRKWVTEEPPIETKTVDVIPIEEKEGVEVQPVTVAKKSTDQKQLKIPDPIEWKEDDIVEYGEEGNKQPYYVKDVGDNGTVIMDVHGKKSFMVKNTELKLISKAVQEEIEQPQKQVLKTNDFGHLNLREIVERIKGQFIGKMKSDRNFQIIHRRSEEVFFDGVAPAAIINALMFVNTVNVDWYGQGQPGTDYLTLIRKAFKESYQISNLQYPESLDKEIEKVTKKKEPKSPPLYRLKKKPWEKKQPKLKRLSRKKKIHRPPVMLKKRLDNDWIFRNGTPKAFIVELLCKHPHQKNEVIRKLQNEYSMTDKEAKAIFTKTIRQLVRVKCVDVHVVMHGYDASGSEDLYYIQPEVNC
jgi:hypothetical protein